MDLISSCANHMNPPLSYIDPTNVGSVRLFAGVTPVSAGGDSIAGTIQVNSAAPEFAKAGEGSCSRVRPALSIAATATAGEPICRRRWPTRCSASTTRARRRRPTTTPQAAASSRRTVGWNLRVAGRRRSGLVAVQVREPVAGFALRHAEHLFELKFGYQHIPYQGFPNQRMDMTDNDQPAGQCPLSGAVRLGFAGSARLSRQHPAQDEFPRGQAANHAARCRTRPACRWIRTEKPPARCSRRRSSPRIATCFGSAASISATTSTTGGIRSRRWWRCRWRA
jgi:hypothetical protein